MSSARLTPYSRYTLSHLQRLSPNDGYAIERYVSSTSKHLFRLKRRNVPLHDEGFLDLVVYNNAVVGIQVLTAKEDVGRGVTIVTNSGKIVSNIDKGESVTVIMANAKRAESTAADIAMAGLRDSISKSSSIRSSISQSASMRDSLGRRSSVRDSIGGSSTRSSLASSTTQRTSNTSNNTTAAAATPIINPLSETDTQLLVQYGGLLVLGLLILKSILNIFSSLSILLAPIAYLYAIQTCPSVESFDTKKELKRVMRGAHLPEEQQPRGFLERSMSRLAASIGTELATSLGYEVSVDDYWGAGRVVWVRVPVAGMDFCWVGVFGEYLCLVCVNESSTSFCINSNNIITQSCNACVLKGNGGI